MIRGGVLIQPLAGAELWRSGLQGVVTRWGFVLDNDPFQIY